MKSLTVSVWFSAIHIFAIKLEELVVPWLALDVAIDDFGYDLHCIANLIGNDPIWVVAGF